MIKSKYFKDFDYNTVMIGYKSMLSEIDNISEVLYKIQIKELFEKAWNSFIKNEWSYDGATFVKERFNNTIFELAAFIHDWRNSNGYVGKLIDKEMFDIMLVCYYNIDLFLPRLLLTKLTFINKLRHKYIIKDLKILPPNNLFLKIS